jgi:rhodanese-related sulfurtransferase
MFRTVEEWLVHARAGLVRLTPTQAAQAQAAGAVLVDIRGDDQIRTHGSIPGAIHVPRNVLEWRADPTSPTRDPRIADPDACVIIVCQEGYQSSLVASSLQAFGLTRATDLEGGFDAWRDAGLPVDAVSARSGSP